MFGFFETRTSWSVPTSSYYAAADSDGGVDADVAAAVTAGTFSSALDHFIAFGQNESREGSGVAAGAGSTAGYPYIDEQLDQLYHDMTNGKLGVAATTGSWYVGITSVKTAFPKP